MKLSKFEKKILTPLMILFLIPLGFAFFFGKTVLKEVYSIGVNRRVSDALAESARVRGQQLRELSETAEKIAEQLSLDAILHHKIDTGDTEGLRQRLAELREIYPIFARLGVSVPGKSTIFVSKVGRSELGQRKKLDIVIPNVTVVDSLQKKSLPDPRRPHLYAEIMSPKDLIHAHKISGQLAKDFGFFKKHANAISDRYLAAYLLLLALVVLFVVLAARRMARTVAARVLALASATARVASGNLEVVIDDPTPDELGDLADAFNEMVTQLRHTRDRIAYLQRLGAWQQVARQLAHEIKNALTPIQLAAQEMERSYHGEDEAYRQKLKLIRQVVEDEVGSLQRLVADFNEISKIPRVQTTQLEVVQLLRNYAHRMDSVIAPRLVFETDSNHMEAMIDEVMLKRCLDNLVQNACDAMVDQSDAQITLALDRLTARLRLVVSNTAGPVADSVLEQMFEPYFTTKSTGTGLGLAIAKKIALEHGGTIECHTTVGRTDFIIQLPILS